MKRIFNLISLCSIIFTTSCALSSDHPNFENFEDFGKMLKGNKTTIVTRKDNPLKIRVYTRNFLDSDKKKLYNAIQILEEVMNSQDLKSLILNYKYKGKSQFHRNKGLSNQQIYNHLMTGAEDLRPFNDNTMDFDLTMYRSWNPFSTVKGYTKPDTMRVWIHSKYYRTKAWTALDVASNMAHEWVHKMGFTHDYYDNIDRPYSVPYAIGGLITTVAKKLGLNTN
jgi:hypothetical protein